jgi:hypothetical protein
MGAGEAGRLKAPPWPRTRVAENDPRRASGWGAVRRAAVA